MTTNKKNLKIKRSVVFPIIMLIYLAVMAWLGRDRIAKGEYLYYYGIVGVSLVIILLLFLSLRKKEQLRERREQEQYSTYEEEDKKAEEKEEAKD